MKPFLLFMLVLAGCGGVNVEALQATNTQIKTDLDSALRQHEEDGKKYAAALLEVAALKKKLDEVASSAALRQAKQGRQIEALTHYHQANAAPPPIDPRGWHQIWAGHPGDSEPHCDDVVSTTFENAPGLEHVPVRRAFVEVRFGFDQKSCPKEKDRKVIFQDDFDCINRTVRTVTITNSNWRDEQTYIDASGFPDADMTLSVAATPNSPLGQAWQYICGLKL